MKTESYKEYLNSIDDSNDMLSFHEWSEMRSKGSPKFFFLNSIMTVMHDILTCDCSMHEADFPSYVRSLPNILLLFFALNHTKYVRAISIHPQDMMDIKESNPTVFQEFYKPKLEYHFLSFLLMKLTNKITHLLQVKVEL